MKYLILALFLTGCSAAWHLQHAQKDLRKAELKGALVKKDTIYKKFRLETIGASTTFNIGAPVLMRQDGVRYLLKDTVFYKDKIRVQIKHDTITNERTVEIKCPDEVKEEVIPVSVTDIEAGYSLGQLFLYGGLAALATLIVGIIIGKLL